MNEEDSQIAAAIRSAGRWIGLSLVSGAIIIVAGTGLGREEREVLVWFVGIIVFIVFLVLLFGTIFGGAAKNRMQKALEQDRRAQLSGRTRQPQDKSE